MKKILTKVVIATTLISGVNFASVARGDAGCTYQGYSCSDWQQQNSN
jgi:opacity protein-like surface antigen